MQTKSQIVLVVFIQTLTGSDLKTNKWIFKLFSCLSKIFVSISLVKSLKMKTVKYNTYEF